MPKKIIFFVAAIYLFVCNPLIYASDLGYKEGELLIRFTSKADGSQRTLSERNVILSGIAGGEIISTNNFVPGLSLVKLPPGKTSILNESLKTDLHSFRGIRNLLDHKARTRSQEIDRQQQLAERMMMGPRLIDRLVKSKRKI